MCAPSRVWALNGGRTGAAREGKQTASNQNHRRQFARKFLGHEIENPPNGHSHCLWPVRGHGNVGDICFGRAASGLHFGIRRIVRLGVDIWLPARRLAIWPHRSDLGVGCRAPLVAKGILTPALWVDFSKSGLTGLCSRGARSPSYKMQRRACGERVDQRAAGHLAGVAALNEPAPSRNRW